MILGLAIAVGLVLLTFIVLAIWRWSEQPAPPFKFKHLELPLTAHERRRLEEWNRIVEAVMSERIRYQSAQLEWALQTLGDLVPEGEELVIVYDHTSGAARRASVGMRRVSQ